MNVTVTHIDIDGQPMELPMLGLSFDADNTDAIVARALNCVPFPTSTFKYNVTWIENPTHPYEPIAHSAFGQVPQA